METRNQEHLRSELIQLTEKQISTLGSTDRAALSAISQLLRTNVRR